MWLRLAPPESAPKTVEEVADLYRTRYRQGLANDATKTSVHYFAVKDVEASETDCDKIISGCRTVHNNIEAEILQRQQFGLEPISNLDRRKASALKKERKSTLDQEKFHLTKGGIRLMD